MVVSIFGGSAIWGAGVGAGVGAGGATKGAGCLPAVFAAGLVVEGAARGCWMLGRGRRLSKLILLLILPWVGLGWVSSNGGETSETTLCGVSGGLDGRNASFGSSNSTITSATCAATEPIAASLRRVRAASVPQSVRRRSSGSVFCCGSTTVSIRLPKTARQAVSALSSYQESPALLPTYDAPRRR